VIIRTIVHISDVHFGRTQEIAVKALTNAVKELHPDAVVVSGDLTQRARRREFEHARAFLDGLPEPQIVVPGNHDVPMHIVARFASALDNYRQYISADLQPFYQDEEVAIAGLNTARSLTIKGGRVNLRQMERVESTLGVAPSNLIKILVTHHPFDLPPAYGRRDLVRRAAHAMVRFARCGVDIYLAGHFHVSHCGRTAERYDFGGYSAIFVQAGTACSTRGRGEPNSFNVIRTNTVRVSVETLSMTSDGSFRAVAVSNFSRESGGWTRTPDSQD
jgi:3',5'-cyclic AMP phosphodiesterase CpdA